MAPALRDARPSDLEAIMSIEHEVFPVDAWPSETMGAELASPHGRYVVAEVARELVGYAGLRVVGDQGDIQTIAVHPSARRLGLGRALLLELLAEAKRRHAREVFLEVRTDNPAAIALYDSLGFAHLAVRPRYYPAATAGAAPVDAIVMRLDRAGLRAAVSHRETTREQQ